MPLHGVNNLFCFFARHFEENPPARVCIETPLPRGGGFAVSLGLANLFRQGKIYLQCIVEAEDVIPHKCFAVFVQIVDRFTYSLSSSFEHL